MKTLTKLPDLAKAAQLLKISIELEGLRGNDLITLSILKCVMDGKIKGAIEMIKDMAFDNYRIMNEVVGEKLLKTILQYCEVEIPVDDLPEGLFQSPPLTQTINTENNDTFITTKTD